MRAQKITRAWNHRLNQSLEEFRTCLAELKSELGLPMGQVNSGQLRSVLQAVAPADLSDAVEVLLLSISMLRAEGQIEESDRCLNLILEWGREKSLVPSFHLFFQKAINSMVKGDSSQALENFLASRMYTTEPREKILAMTNALFCLDNLGLPFEKTLNEVRELVTQTECAKDVAQCLEQIRQLEMRLCLRNGDFSVIANLPDHAGFGQIDYFKAWTLSLPYHSGYVAFEQMDLEKISLANPYFYKKGFRLRTLQGLCHPSDDAGYNATEMADRFYLWVWKWLTRPDDFPLTKIMNLIKGFDLSKISNSLTDEDYDLFKNALAWLGLFDPINQPQLERMLLQVKPFNGRHMPIWSFEFELVSYLMARRDRRLSEAADILQSLQDHPLWKSSSLHFSQIVRALNEESSPLPARLEKLVKSLKRIVSPDEKLPQHNGFVVDLVKEQIEPGGGAATINSSALTRAFDLLHAKGSVRCHEFLMVAFGLPGYEPLVHDQKIFNLLARMRQFGIPGLRVGVKSGSVFATGSWSHVVFIRPPEDGRHLGQYVEWQSFLDSRVSGKVKSVEKIQKWLRPNLLMKKLSEKKEFTREDIEALAGTSRSTANRLLKSWADHGMIGRRGHARCTTYHFLDEAERTQKKLVESGPP